jgi:hypothetical protein
MPTAALVVAALPAAAVNGTFQFRIKNGTAFTETLVAGAGNTLPNTVIIPAFSEGVYYGTITNVGTPAITYTHLGTFPIAAANSVVTPTLATLSTAGAGTITAAMIVGGAVQRTGSQSNTAFTDTTATAAAIIAAAASLVAKVGGSFWFLYENTTDATATITGDTGVTVSGISTVAAKAWTLFLITQDTAGTCTMVGVYAAVTPNAVNGTFVCNGVTPVTVADTRVTANSSIIVTLKTIGGTVGAVPAVKTITPGTGFTIAGTASDSSTYNYLVIN